MAFRTFAQCGSVVFRRLPSSMNVTAPTSQMRFVAMTAENKSILDHLLKTEADARDYYSELAAKSKNKGFKTIFEMIAKEEVKHVQWLKDLAAGGGELAAAAKYDVSILGDIKKEIAAMKESRKDLNKLCADQVELYRAARDMEAQSRDFYAARAKHATDPRLKKLLEELAKEEHKHYQLIHGLLQFISEEEEGYEVDALNFWVNMDAPISEMGKP